MATNNSTTTRNNFIFTCARMPLVCEAATEVSLPKMSMGIANFPWQWHYIEFPGRKMTYDPMNVDFLVDENFNNHKEIYDWYQDIRHFAGTDWKDCLSDGSIIILSNNKVPLREYKFSGMWPMVLSEIQFTTRDQAEAQTCSLTLKYDELTIVDL